MGVATYVKGDFPAVIDVIASGKRPRTLWGEY